MGERVVRDGADTDTYAPFEVTDELVDAIYRSCSRFSSDTSAEMEKLRIRRALLAADKVPPDRGFRRTAPSRTDN